MQFKKDFFNSIDEQMHNIKIRENIFDKVREGIFTV